MAKKISPERQALLNELVDIRDVKIDRTLPVEERMISYVQQIKNPYMFKVSDTVARVSYIKGRLSPLSLVEQMQFTPIARVAE